MLHCMGPGLRSIRSAALGPSAEAARRARLRTGSATLLYHQYKVPANRLAPILLGAGPKIVIAYFGTVYMWQCGAGQERKIHQAPDRRDSTTLEPRFVPQAESPAGTHRLTRCLRPSSPRTPRWSYSPVGSGAGGVTPAGRHRRSANLPPRGTLHVGGGRSLTEAAPLAGPAAASSVPGASAIRSPGRRAGTARRRRRYLSGRKNGW